ncbi:DUF3299 domain-containing protein [Algicola sagamiensis]|uniref:DUF3299 domain-containing protein n=1 Tax=Algicola sagamiensis TaxID=163869 RepID=UPI001B7F95E3|nr:DUF3299 domain-containing protein [Algicola sagamiensis]
MQTQSNVLTEDSQIKYQFKMVEWTELMPEEDLDAILNPPSYITDVEDGSIEDQIESQLQNKKKRFKDDRYQRALTSTKVIPEMNNKPIRIAGYVVPLAFNEAQRVTHFFLVPYYGACIHVPPPPPNQIIYVEAKQGFKLVDLYDAFWVSGWLQTSLIENDTATAAYRMQMQSIQLYSE